MSLSGSDAVENNSLNIPNILADFFLKKLNMPSYSDDSDYKHKMKKKKSKHKKRKHKKSKSKHRSNSSISSTSSASNDKSILDDVSSSEEMGMKRLKKIKDLKLNSANKNALQTLISSDKQSESAEKNNPSSSADLVYYGPSLELLLSGVDSNHSNSKSEVVLEETNSKEKEFADLKQKNNLDKIESKEVGSCIEIENNLKTPLSSASPCNPNHDNQKDLDITQEIVNNNVSSHEEDNKKDCSSSFNTDQTNMEKEIVNQKENVKECIDKEKCNSGTNDTEVEKTKLKSESKNRNSRSCSKSDEHRSKLKHRKRSRSKSRSSSRGSHKISKIKKRKHSHSRSKSRETSKSYSKRSHSRSHSRSRSRSRHSKFRKYSQSRSPYRRDCHRNSRSRSRSQSGHRKYSESSKSREHSSRSRNRSRSYRHSSHSRSRSKSKSRTVLGSKEIVDSRPRSRSKSKEKKSTIQKSGKIDQAKVLETAKQNIRNMIKNGTLPEGLNAEILKKEQLISIQAGGKSVQELTEYCQRLSQKENDPDQSEDEKDDDKPDDETGFIHHPFKVKEPATIKLNIKNAVQLPIKTHAQKVAETARLSSQFPVSSGNEHRQKELEWIPVVPDKPKPIPEPINKNASPPPMEENTVAIIETPVSSTVQTPVPISCPSTSGVTQSSATPPVPAILPPPVPPPPLPPSLPTQMPSTPLLPTPDQNFMLSYPTPNQLQVTAIPASAPASTAAPAASPLLPSPPVFRPQKKLDISSIVAKRFQALTKLQHSPNDAEALRTIQEAQESIQEWVQSQQVPGLFTGSTDARVLSVAELCGPKYYKFKKNILTQAPPVTEGKGMSLLKKMGWNPGEGLGKNKEGSLEPLVLDIKMDKKGLVSEGENSKKPTNSFMKELQGKHPVSALMELCSKRKWKPPLYTCVLDHGPPHKKLFCFKVEVNGVEYQPLNPCSNKKVAKADSAIICLQALNVFPKEP